MRAMMTSMFRGSLLAMAVMALTLSSAAFAGEACCKDKAKCDEKKQAACASCEKCKDGCKDCCKTADDCKACCGAKKDAQASKEKA